MTKIDEIIKVLQQQMQMQPGLRRHNIYYFTGYRSEPHERLFALLIQADGEPVLFCPKWK